MSAPKQIRIGAKRSSHSHRWMRWRMFITLIGGLAIAWPLASYAQQPKQPLKRVGVLVEAPCPHRLTQPDNLGPWFARLSELGWIEGQTIVFDCVSTVGRLDQVAALVIAGLWLLYEWPAATIIALVTLAMVCHMLRGFGLSLTLSGSPVLCIDW